MRGASLRGMLCFLTEHYGENIEYVNLILNLFDIDKIQMERHFRLSS